MPAREVIEAWETIIDECAELYEQVRATVADLPEIKTDLSGTTAKGSPPPLPGGDKLAATGPFSLDAPHDDFPHPLRVAYKWSWHCAEVNAAIPPRRAWEPCIAYLRAHLHLIDGEHVSEFHEELRAVRGTLRRICNWDRRSQAEEYAAKWLRGEEAAQRLRVLAETMPDRHPVYEGDPKRGPVMLTRGEIELLWPAFEPESIEEYADPQALCNLLWERVKRRKKYLIELGDTFPEGLYAAEWARETLRLAKVS